MAINILVEPTNPPIAGDFTLDQAIQHACETPVGSILTLWEDTASIPAAQQTSFIRHAGNTFQVQGSNEAISGSLSAGINYIAATESAGVITLAWVTSLTGYAYNQAYGGIYNGSGMQILRDVCTLSGTDYIRGFTNPMGSHTVADLPIGYIYTQYPTKKSPLEMGFIGSWANISSDFPGDFFRAEGGNASAFESGEQGDVNKAHTHSISGYANTAINNNTIVFGTTAVNPQSTATASSGSVEARPINHTVRLWERVS